MKHNRIINYNGLRNVYGIFVLNLLWVLCSIPLITMGAATTALYYCMLKINHGDNDKIIPMFFNSFRQNLRQGCILTSIFGFSGLFLVIDLWACQMIVGFWKIIIIGVLALLLVIWGVLLSYAFPLIAQFEDRLNMVLNNAVWLSVLHVKETILIFVINAIPVVVFFGAPYVFMFCVPLLMTFGVSLIAMINSRILMDIFEKYMEKRDE